MAAATRFKPAEVKKALKALAAGKLIEFSKDKARGLFEGKVIQLLPLTPETSPVRTALRKNWDTWLETSKRVACKRRTIRMTRENLGLYRQHLEKAVNLAEIYANAAADRKDSSIYFIDASIFKVLPRD